MDSVLELYRLIILGVLLVIFLYAAARAMSWAYFRTKLEHHRNLRKTNQEMEEGD